MVITKLDFLKVYPEYYTATLKPKLVELEPYNYIALEGHSAPNSLIFEESVGQIYALAFNIKFICKAMEMDFKVPKLEAFWWSADELPLEQTPMDQWHWKLILRMPDFVGEEELGGAIENLIAKGKIPHNHNLKLESIHEGKSVQIMHIGAYNQEDESLKKLFGFVEEQGLAIDGHHHEIYISDPRKVEEAKLKTILRYAVK